MGGIANFGGVPPATPTLVPNIPHRVNPLKNRIIENDQRPENLDMVLVQHNQDADQVLRQARQNNMGYMIISPTSSNVFWYKMDST